MDKSSNKISLLNARDVIAVLIILSGWAYFVFGSPIVADDEPIDLLAVLKIETGPNGGPVARLDRELCKRAFEKAGLPEPPNLDGTDPVPVRKLLDAYTKWAATNDPKALADMGMIFQALDEHQPALQCFAALLVLDPANSLWRYYAGVESQSLGMEEAAISFFEQLLIDDKDYATTYARLGSLYLATNDLKKAQANYEKYKQMLPNQSLSYIGLGRVELARNNTIAAETLFRQAVEATTNDYMAYRMLGQALSRNNKTDEAKMNLKIADRLPQYRGWLVFDSRLMESHTLAQTQKYLENQMRLAQGDAEKLISLGEQLLVRRPNDSNTQGLVASAYAKQNNFEKALEIVDRSLELDSDSVKMLCLRARLFFYSGNIDEAYKTLDEVVSIDSNFSTAYELRGSFMYQQNRFDEAKMSLTRCVELDPLATDARLVLAIIHRQSSDFVKARKYLLELLQIDPNNFAGNRLLQGLPQN